MEVRFDPYAISGHAGRQDENWHRVGIRLGYSAESVLRAGSVLRQKDSSLFAVGDSGESIGHVYPGALLPATPRANASNGSGFYQRIRGHYCYPVNTLHFQHVGYSGHSVHGTVPPG